MADPENLYDNSHSTQLGAAAPAASHHAPYNYAPYSHPSNLSAFQPGASANSAYLRIPNAYHGSHVTATAAATTNLPCGSRTASKRPIAERSTASNRLMPPYENSALDLPPSCSPMRSLPCIHTATWHLLDRPLR